MQTGDRYMPNKFNCPKCGSAVNAWADLDATVIFKINNHGKLIKRVIKNANQTDGRCGVECTECDWTLYADSDYSEYPHFEELACQALAYEEEIETLSVKSKYGD